jgi:hypothetical protein
MPELSFSVVQRPGKASTSSVLPGRLIDAIDKTVTSGQAVRLDTSGWTQNRVKTVYRALHTWGKGAAYTVVRRRTETEIYVWGVRR